MPGSNSITENSVSTYPLRLSAAPPRPIHMNCHTGLPLAPAPLDGFHSGYSSYSAVFLYEQSISPAYGSVNRKEKAGICKGQLKSSSFLRSMHHHLGKGNIDSRLVEGFFHLDIQLILGVKVLGPFYLGPHVDTYR